MANYLVTGAAGFIGATNIAHKLLKQGHKVCTIDNLSTGCVECIFANFNASKYYYMF